MRRRGTLKVFADLEENFLETLEALRCSAACDVYCLASAPHIGCRFTELGATILGINLDKVSDRDVSSRPRGHSFDVDRQ